MFIFCGLMPYKQEIITELTNETNYAKYPEENDPWPSKITFLFVEDLQL